MIVGLCKYQLVSRDTYVKWLSIRNKSLILVRILSLSLSFYPSFLLLPVLISLNFYVVAPSRTEFDVVKWRKLISWLAGMIISLYKVTLVTLFVVNQIIDLGVQSVLTLLEWSIWLSQISWTRAEEEQKTTQQFGQILVTTGCLTNNLVLLFLKHTPSVKLFHNFLTLKC